MIIYQIYPRSFRDSSGNGIGDLRGAAEKLPYVAKLGVDAVWLSPFQRSPQKDFGYDVSDYCDVDPRFGTMDDFRAFLHKAHALGLKVLIDQVWCHCSDRHPWFEESRQSRGNEKADWFVWTDPREDGSPCNNWRAYFGGSAWAWEGQRGQYYFHQFLVSQPTFNLRHPAVRRALLDVGRFWLEMGVDGFRMDAVHTGFADPELRDNPPRPRNLPLPPDLQPGTPQAHQIRLNSEGHPDTLPFLEELRSLTDEYGAVLLGEVSGEDPFARAALYTRGKRLHMAYNFGLLAGPPGADYFRNSVAAGEASKDGGNYCYALSNHDVKRVVSRYRATLPEGNAVPLARIARAALLFGLTLPGTYCLYQGEELGLQESVVPYESLQDPFGIAFYPRFVGRDGCRTPMPWKRTARNGGFSRAKTCWLPFDEAQRPFAVDAQAGADSTLRFARALIKWRRTHPALAGDGFHALETTGHVIAYQRHASGPALSTSLRQKLLCMFNFGGEDATLELPPGKWRPVHKAGAVRQDKIIHLPPMSGMVLGVREWRAKKAK